jgi:hypothetical protein
VSEESSVNAAAKFYFIAPFGSGKKTIKESHKDHCTEMRVFGCSLEDHGRYIHRLCHQHLLRFLDHAKGPSKKVTW